MKGAAHFINPGLCEFDEMGFVLHFLRSEDLFVDVGANVGAYTVLASGVIGARTIAFEPNPSTFKYLERNIAENGSGTRARGINAALGAPAAINRATVYLPAIATRIEAESLGRLAHDDEARESNIVFLRPYEEVLESWRQCVRHAYRPGAL